MSKIIQFPTKESNSSSKWEELIDSVFIDVNPELKKNYKKEFVAILNKYSFEENITLDLPESITAEQVQGIKDVFSLKNKAINDIREDLLKAKYEIAKLKSEYS